MTELQIDLADGRRTFRPGESLTGVVSWNVSGVTTAELRLFWYTRGKGTQDVGVVETINFFNPVSSDRRPFRLALPDGPYSFSGPLVSILWAIELILEPGPSVERREIVISPSEQEVVVTHASA